MDPPEGNYIAWTLPGTTTLSFLPEAEAWLYHREGESEAVQLRVRVREGPCQYRMLLNRQPDRRFSGQCEVLRGESRKSENVCLLTCGVLNADATVDHGLALGEVQWLSPGAGLGHWMGHFRKLNRGIVDPNSFSSSDSATDDLEDDSPNPD